MNTTTSSAGAHSFDEDDEPLLPRKGHHHEATFDITAMIDLVFMLNIFFLVTTVAAAQMEMELPIVRHCLPVDPEEAVFVSVIAPDPQSVTVYLGDGTQGDAYTEREEQVRAVHQAVEEASRSGKRVVLLKAERAVKLRDIKRISAAAVRDFPTMELRVAVIEKE